MNFILALEQDQQCVPARVEAEVVGTILSRKKAIYVKESQLKYENSADETMEW